LQYMSPHAAANGAAPPLEISTVYCRLRGAKSWIDPDSRCKNPMGIPLLEVPLGRDPQKGQGFRGFLGIVKPRLEISRPVISMLFFCHKGWIQFRPPFGALSCHANFLAPLPLWTGCHHIEPVDHECGNVTGKRLFGQSYTGLQVRDRPSPEHRDLLRSLGIPKNASA